MARKTAPTRKTETSTRGTRKTTSSRSSRAKTVVAAHQVEKNEKVTPEQSTATTELQKSASVKLRKSYVIGIVVVLLLAILLYLFRGLFIVATVNGQPISRLTVISQLEKQGGKQALNSLITKSLIEQEAQKDHVTVSQSEIDNEMKTIEANISRQGGGQKLDDVLQAQGMTRQTLQDQIRLQKLVEKMVGKNITVSDKEAADYLDKNKDSLPPGTTAANAKQRVKQLKLNQKVQEWISNLQKNAKIDYYVKY